MTFSMVTVSRCARCVEHARLRQASLLTNYNKIHVKAELKISLSNLGRILQIYTSSSIQDLVRVQSSYLILYSYFRYVKKIGM